VTSVYNHLTIECSRLFNKVIWF